MKISQAKYTGDGRGTRLDTSVRFWFDGMLPILEAAAVKVAKTSNSMYGVNLEVDELVSFGWFQCGRHCKSAEYAKRYLYLNAVREMKKFAMEESKWRYACNDKLNIVYRENEK